LKEKEIKSKLFNLDKEEKEEKEESNKFVGPFIPAVSESFFEGLKGEENYLDVEYVNENEKPPKSLKNLQLNNHNKTGLGLT
jgi:hypothetical protein